MFDEIKRLRDCGDLQHVLVYYAQLGAADRTVWQSRLLALEGVSPRDLVKLHGELLANEWLEQNTGAAVCGYRVTSAGLKALKRAQTISSEEEESATS